MMEAPVPAGDLANVDPVLPEDSPAFVDMLMPMWVPRAGSLHMDRYWLRPRPEQPDKIDMLRSKKEVQRYLEGDRSSCKNYSRATYEKLLALTDGVPGVRDVTTVNQSVIGRRDPSVYESPLYGIRVPHRPSALGHPGVTESRAIIMHPPAHHRTFYVVLPDDRRLHGSKGVEAYFTHGNRSAGSVIPGLYARLLPHTDLDGGNPAVLCSSCDGSDPREEADEEEWKGPRVLKLPKPKPKQKPKARAYDDDGESDVEGASAGRKRRRRHRMLGDDPSHDLLDGAAAADPGPGVVLRAPYSRSERRHGRGAVGDGEGAALALCDAPPEDEEEGEDGEGDAYAGLEEDGESEDGEPDDASCAAAEAEPAAAAGAGGDAPEPAPSDDESWEDEDGESPEDAAPGPSQGRSAAAAATAGPCSAPSEGAQAEPLAPAVVGCATPERVAEGAAAAAAAASAGSTPPLASPFAAEHARPPSAPISPIGMRLPATPAPASGAPAAAAASGPAAAGRAPGAGSPPGGSASADDAAAAAFSLAARMRSRLEAMRSRIQHVEHLGSQLAEALERRGAAASVAQKARSAAAIAASASEAAAKASSTAKARETAERLLAQRATELAAAAVAEAEAAKRRADSAATEAEAAREAAKAAAAGAASAADAEAAAQRDAEDAAMRARGLEAELARWADQADQADGLGDASRD